MFLHDTSFNNFSIAHGDTLMDSKHWDDEPFDAIVSNPPIPLSGKVIAIGLLSTTLASRGRACT